MAAALPTVTDCCSPCSGDTVTIVTADGYQVVDTIVDLRALASGNTNEVAFVRGGLAAYDGQGGVYIWQALATNADDGIEFIKPDDLAASAAGRWRKHH